jgi:hypothetical protein
VTVKYVTAYTLLMEIGGRHRGKERKKEKKDETYKRNNYALFMDGIFLYRID